LQPFFISSLQHSTTYEIQFSGLALGQHDFEWPLEPTFFKRFENEEILESDLHAKVSLDKKERLMNLTFTIEGKVKTLCDRCGDEVWTDIEAEDEIVARFSNETDLSNDDVIFLNSSEYKLDIGQFLYEFSLLAVPQKRVHDEGECNPAAEEFFDELEEDEEENEKEEKEIDDNDYIDPRWEALKKLK